MLVLFFALHVCDEVSVSLTVSLLSQLLPRIVNPCARVSSLSNTLLLTLLQVNVFGFGADSRGNWHHYWEQNRYSGEFRKTGVHDADYEAQIIQRLAKAGKITVFPGK